MSFDPTYLYNGDASDPRVCDGEGNPYPEDSLFQAARKTNDVQDAIAVALAAASTSGHLVRALTGGGEALDGIDGSTLSDGEMATAWIGSNPARISFYTLDADNGGTEDVPNIIAPDLNAGNKRWVLAGRIKRLWPSDAEPTVDDDSTAGIIAGDFWMYQDHLWICASPAAGAAIWRPIIEAHSQLSGAGTNPHSAIDTFIASKAQASGLASLDAQGKVAQLPAAATATPGAAAIPISNGDSVLDGWISDASATKKGLIKLAGQLGGTAALPTVTGITESGGQALAMGPWADGQFLKRDGTTAKGVAATATNSVCEGRLEVLPAYYQTSGAANWQLNGTDKGIGFLWHQRVDCAITSGSFHVGAYASTATLTVAIYDLTLSENHACGTTANITATGWKRHAFDAVQLCRNHQYMLRLTWVSGDCSISYRSPNTAVGSAIPDGCSGYTTTDNWLYKTALTQNAMSAMPNMILGINLSDVPPLVFGSRKGQYVDIPGTGLMQIPAAGVYLDCAVCSADTNYWVYIYSNSGTLTLEATTAGPVYSNGIQVRSNATTHRLLGPIRCPALIGAGVGPADVSSRRLVQNVENREQRIFAKQMPYSSATYDGGVGNTFEGWNGSATEWRIEALCLNSRVSLRAHSVEYVGIAATNEVLLTSIGMDGTNPSPKGSAGEVTVGATTPTMGNAVAFLEDEPDDGFHYWLPLQMAPTGAPYHYLMQANGQRAGFMGTIEC